MNILQLSPQFPFPLTDGGKISISNMTRALVQEGCTVRMLCLSQTKPTDQDLEAFSSYTGAHCEIVQHDTTNSPLSILYSLFDFQDPLYIRKHRSVAFEVKLRSLLNTHSFDGILCDHSAMAEYGILASAIIGKPLTIRMHNIEHVIWERYAQRFHSLDPRHIYIASQARKLQRKECEYSSKASYAAMITEHDVNIINGMAPSVNAVYVPVGIDTDLFVPSSTAKKLSNRMIHATTYDWIHNIEAIDWFIAKILPELHANEGAELCLLGKNMPQRYLNESAKGVQGLGFVEDINSALNSASFYVAPLFVGGGIRIKILEAMASGLPVIASPISAEGIHASREDGLIICSTADEFIQESTYLLQHPDTAKQLGLRARSFIMQNHSWKSAAKSMMNLFRNDFKA